MRYWPASSQVKGCQMARKPTELRPLMTRIPERLRRQLEKAAVRIDRSMNAEIIHRLEQSFQADADATRLAELERAILQYHLPAEQAGGSLIALVALGGQAGRIASMAAVATE